MHAYLTKYTQKGGRAIYLRAEANARKQNLGLREKWYVTAESQIFSLKLAL